MSYIESVKIESESEKPRSSPSGLFFFLPQPIENKYFAHNPFRMNILQTLPAANMNKGKDILPKYPQGGGGGVKPRNQGGKNTKGEQLGSPFVSINSIYSQ
jgi:hypothetical protein